MIAVGAVQLLILLLGLARAKFLSVSLGPAGYGLVSTIDQLVLALISLGAIGLPFAGLKFMARAHSEGQESFERTYVGFLWALASLGVLTAATGITLAVFTPEIFGRELAGYSPLLALAMLGIPAAMVNILVANALAAAQRGTTSALVTLGIQGALFATTVAGVLAAGPRGLYIATATGGLLVTVVTVASLRRSLGSPAYGSLRWLRSAVRRENKILAYSAWIYLATAGYAVSLSGLRTSVFSHLGATSAGLLQAALGLALTMGAVINPISNLILTPYLNRTIATPEKVSSANQFASRVLTLLFFAALPLVLFPRLVISVLFAPEFLPAAGILFAFILWQCLAQFVNVYTQLLIGLDDVGFACGTMALSYGTVFLLAPLTTARFGLQGAAGALIIGSTLGGVTNLVRLKERFGAHLERRVAARLTFTIGMIAAGVAVSFASEERSSRGVMLRAAVAVLCIAAQWVLLDNGERDWVRSRFRGLGLSRNAAN
ncbi:MAG TPA: hypothetical protein VHM24_02170 [Gemmatimonadaceae bacterium]|nr:hypothetical protein [Gemmatimonadaceae bacterium]